MILNALQDKPLPVYGQGLNIRDWLYVEDHCKAIDMILQHGKIGDAYQIAMFAVAITPFGTRNPYMKRSSFGSQLLRFCYSQQFPFILIKAVPADTGRLLTFRIIQGFAEGFALFHAD